MTLRTFAAACLMSGALAFPAHAETVRGDYVLSLFGLPGAAIDLAWTTDGERYDLTGKLRSSAIASIVQKMDGSLGATGRMTETGLQPSSYFMSYTARRPWNGKISWNGDTVASNSVQPDQSRRHRRETWVPLDESSLNGVVDPFTALTLHASDASEVCDRTLRVFDGEARMDVPMSCGQRVKLSIPGAADQGVRCKARVKPMSGYDNNPEKDLAEVARSTITATFVPIGNDLWVPAQIDLPVSIGTLKLTAKRFH